MMYESTKKRVGIWVRVSTEMQVVGDSPEVHLKRAEDYAKNKGWEVVTVYKLNGISGANILELTDTRRMLHDVKTGRINTLLFSRLDRVGRNAIELMLIEKELSNHNAHLVSIFEDIDTSTAQGMKRFQDLASQAEYERKQLSDRVKAGIHTRLEKGEIFTKEAPYGYKKENKKFVPHPEESFVVEEMFKLFLEHRRYKTVARILNNRGYRTSRGNEFTNVSVRFILSNPVCKGLYIANRTFRKSKGFDLYFPGGDQNESSM